MPRPAPPRSATAARPGRRAAVLLALAGLAILPYLNTLSADFVLDDVYIVKENEQLRRLGNIPGLFTSHYWSGTSTIADRGLYRPLTMATYALNHALHGRSPVGYHVVNVLLHAVATLLVFAVIRRCFESEPAALLAAAWFAVHPIHTEAVAGIVGRAEILAAIGVFGCLYAYERARAAAAAGRSRRMGWWAAAAVSSYALGCFSKEIAVVAPALVVALELLRPGKRWLLRARPAALGLVAALGVVAGAYLIVRSAIVADTIPHPGWRLTTASGQVGVVSAELRAWTALRIGLEYVGLTLWPGQLAADYWITDVPLARGPFEPGPATGLLVIAGGVLLVSVAWRRAPEAAFGVLLFAITLFPVSNLPFAIGVMKAERLMYTPSAGLLLVPAAGAALLLRRPALGRPVWIAAAAVALVLGIRTHIRNLDWQSNRTLAEATLRVSPNSPIMNTNLGLWYREQGDLDQARAYVARAADAEPLNGDTRALLGDIAKRAGRLDEAIAHLEQAARLAPRTAQILIDLAETYFITQRWADAARTLERVRELRPNKRASYINLAGAYLNLGDAANALRVAEEGLRRFPDKGSVQAIAAEVYAALGREADAQRCRARAAQLGVERSEDE